MFKKALALNFLINTIKSKLIKAYIMIFVLGGWSICIFLLEYLSMSNHQKYRNSTILAKAIALSGFVSFCFCFPALSNPLGGVVVGGVADITGASKEVNIDVQSQNAVIDWQGFDIGVDEVTNINQLSSSSVLVNRVKNTQPSFIFGKLNANGNIVITNPNGVVFGKSSHIDVNGLVASTSTMDNIDQFINDGIVQLNKGQQSENIGIINQGLLTVKQAGLVGFVAPNVENNGVIIAKMGRVHLASGDTATVDFYGDGLMEVAVSDDVTSQSVINTGGIYAQGGKIALTAAAGKQLINSVIIASGELKAPSFKQEKGVIKIYGEGSNAVKNNRSDDKGKKKGSSTILVDGSIDASGRSQGETGGDVEILGDNIALGFGTIIDASGDQGGGDIKIGGDYLGSGSTPTAKNTYIDKQVLIANDAITNGSGGRTIIWSDDTTKFHGNIFARGGVDGGNGGFAETSGKKYLKADGFVDLSPRHESGLKGQYLLDPNNITIFGNFNPNSVSNLQAWFDGADKNTVIDGDGNSASSSDFSGNVAVWIDKSGNGNDISNASSTGRPSYNQTGKNGNGIVSFDGFDALFANDIDVSSLDLSSNEFSYFGVVNPIITTGTRTLFNKGDSYGASIRKR
ncbi:MAG TPA: filamentous hemagglutinin N-terminal domain-containing protein, partial [Oceanospirillales bacterium]|nr:filamentous hemagglutinin N-terminal domain-containing protein [Oceanospirillales bacterium]